MRQTSRKKTEGYVVIYCPEHPNASKHYKEVYEHRLVMEKHLKRYLLSSEIVHHINNIRDDNRIENLKLMTQNNHASEHGKGNCYCKGKYKHNNTKNQRQCWKCQRILPIDQFYFNKYLPLKRSYMCKICKKAYQSEKIKLKKSKVS